MLARPPSFSFVGGDHCGRTWRHSPLLPANSATHQRANSSIVRNFRFLCTSRLIGEPLTLEALKSNLGAAHVIHPKPFAGVLAEIKLGNIPLQMLAFDMLVHADY